LCGKNWKSASLGKEYDIYELDGEIVGQQFPSDTVSLDILAISKDRKTFLEVELQKGRVSDNIVGQIQRYMGYVKEDLAEPHQHVIGIITGSEDDLKIRRAFSVTNNIEFYRNKVNLGFKYSTILDCIIFSFLAFTRRYYCLSRAKWLIT